MRLLPPADPARRAPFCRGVGARTRCRGAAVAKLRTFVGSHAPELPFKRRPSRAPTIRSVRPSARLPPEREFQQRRRARSPRRGTANCTASLFFLRGSFVGIDDAGHQRMAHYVLRARTPRRRCAHAGEDLRASISRFSARAEIDRVIAVDHRLAPKPMRVRNIFICSGVCSAPRRMMNEWFSVRPRIRQRRQLDVPRSRSLPVLSKPIRSYSAS